LVLYKSNLNKKFEESFMITFIATHMNKCEVLNCGLSQNSVIVHRHRLFKNLRTVTKQQTEGLFSTKLSKNFSFFSSCMSKDIQMIYN